MTLDELKALMAQAEFHKVLKVEPIACDATEGAVRIRLPYNDILTLFPKIGNYHGGVIASLADIAGTMACTVATGRATPTINLRVDYLKTPRKVDLIGEGLARKIGQTVGVADVVILDEDETVYALGRGTFRTVAE